MYGLGVNTLGVSNSGGNGGYTPPASGISSLSELFDSSEKGFWYDPSDSSTVFSDIAGTTAATIGGPVGKINDKSGNNFHLTAHADNRRPTYARHPANGLKNIYQYNSQQISTSTGYTLLNTTSSSTSVSPPFGTDTVYNTAINSSGAGVALASSAFLPDFADNHYRLYVKRNGANSDECNGFLLQGWGTTNSLLVDLENEQVQIPSYSGGNAPVISLTSVGNGWYRLDMTQTGLSLTTSPQVVLQPVEFTDSSFTNTTSLTAGSGLYFFGMQHGEGTTFDTYQKVTSKYDVVQSGQSDIEYIKYEGSDALGSDDINLASDNISVLVSSSKAEPDEDMFICKTGNGNPLIEDNTFGLSYNTSGNNRIFASNSGTSASSTFISDTALLTVPRVITLLTDISDDTLILRINKNETNSSSNQGTYSSVAKDLNVGSKQYDTSGSLANGLEGNIYQIAGVDNQLTGNILTNAETLVGTKAGITI